MKVRSSIFIFLTLIVSFSFTACGNLLTEDASITIDAEKVARYLGRNADTSVLCRSGARDVADDQYMSYGMILTASTVGSYETSVENKYLTGMDEPRMGEPIEELYKKASGTAITLDSIPVGARIKVKVSLTLGSFFDEAAFRRIRLEQLKSEGSPILENEQELESYFEGEIANQKAYFPAINCTIEGTSETFTVRRGPNTIKIKIGDDSLVIPIMVYSNKSTGYEISIQKYGDKTTLISDASRIWSYIDYCSDNNGYYYVLCYDSNVTKIYSNNPVFSDGYVSIPNQSANIIWKSIAYDSVTNKLYGYWNQEGNLKIVVFPKLVSEGVIDEASDAPLSSDTYTAYQFSINPSGSEISEIETFAVYNNNLYVAKKYCEEMTNFSGVQGIRVYSSALDNSFDFYHATFEDDDEYLFDIYELTGWNYVDDMVCINGTLYITGYSINDTITNYFEGGLLKYNLSTNTWNVIQAGQRSMDVECSPTESFNFTVKQPDSETSKAGFFTPKRFIGIKPKKLVVADDGQFFYTLSGNKGYYKNVNRVVVVDLDSFSISNVQLTDEIFEREITSLEGGYTPYVEAFECAD